jgi:hypothetical protein
MKEITCVEFVFADSIVYFRFKNPSIILKGWAEKNYDRFAAYFNIVGFWQPNRKRQCCESGFLNPDTNPDQGFDDQKLRKKYSWIFFIIFSTKNRHFLIPRPDVQTTAKALKSTYRNFFLFLWVIFALLDPVPDCETGYESGSTAIETG